MTMRLRLPSLMLTLPLALSACDSKSAPQGKQEAKPDTKPEGATLADNAAAVVLAMRSLEVSKDVTCWTSFRQLDTFISSKAYSEFATLTRIMASKALVRGVWAKASAQASGPVLGPEDLERVFSIEAELDEAKAAELQKFASDQGWQEFRDYRTTSEHWRVLLSIVSDELARKQSDLKPLDDAGLERLAYVATRAGLALLKESGQISTAARTPLIEAEHVQKAYANLVERYGVPKTPAPGPLDHAAANQVRVPLTGALIEAKITALREYNHAGDDLRVELNKVSKIPLDESAVDRLVSELRSMTRFFAQGYEPMRADNYLADGRFAPAHLEGKPYITAEYVENASAQIWPYVMMPNGDVKMRFEPRPGNVGTADLKGQDVVLLDHQMNAVRDTALHWVVMQREWADNAFAMDAFAAEYVSELISIIATYNIRRAQTLARAAGDEVISERHIAAARDVRYVATAVSSEDTTPASWDDAARARKAEVLAATPGPLFRDATTDWGLPDASQAAATIASAPEHSDFDVQEMMGAGIAVGDLDADGFVDVFIAGPGKNRLYRNEGGKRLRDVTAQWLPEAFAKPLVDVRGALMVDIDQDADLDFVVLRSRAPSMVLRNDGKTFVDISETLGFKPGPGAHSLCAFDYENDGDLDLYVGFYGSRRCNDADCSIRNLPSMDGRNGSPNQLYRNDGDTWTEVGARAGVADEGWTLSVSTFDFDADGALDLYLANDFGANPLLRNRGDGTFEDVAAQVGAADRGSGMNVSFSDVDQSGSFDVFVSNIDMFSKNVKVVFPTDDSQIGLSDRILKSFQYLSGNKLYLTQPKGEGTEGPRFIASEQDRFEPGDQGWAWAGIFADVDLDRDEDLYLANGWIPESPAADQANLLFVRDGDMFYRAASGAHDLPGNSRSVVALDLDNDGDLDLVVNNFRAGAHVLENQVQASETRRWVMLRPVRPDGRPVVGTVVAVGGGGTVQRRLVTAGEGYLGQQEPRLHFGLGDAARVDVNVRWPDGKSQAFPGLDAGRVHVLEATD